MCEKTPHDTDSANNSNLTVAFYFFRLNMSSGGAERMLIQLAEEMSYRGHNIHIISWDSDDAKSFYPLSQKITWHKLGFKKGWKDKIRRTILLHRLLRSISCQIFVGFVMSSDKSVYAACSFAKVPIVVAERNSPIMYDLKYSAIKKAFYMWLLMLAKLIIIQIDTYRSEYPRLLDKRIHAIPNPVKQANCLANPSIKTDAKWTLLCVARLEPQKNLDVLIHAFSSLASDFGDWQLRIIGEGSLRKELEDLIDRLDLKRCVLMPGATNNIEQEYANAHLFCMPSRWEGFPNALAEAMAHGLPAIGFSECHGVNSIIDNGIDGILAPGVDNEKSLSWALQELMSDPDKRGRMGNQARLLSERFNFRRIAGQWEKLLLIAAGLNDL